MPDRLAKHCANSGRLNRLEPFFCTPPEKGRFCKRPPHLGSCCVVYFMNEINTDAIGSAGWLFAILGYSPLRRPRFYAFRILL